jgi:hypothetical protein
LTFTAEGYGLSLIRDIAAKALAAIQYNRLSMLFLWASRNTVHLSAAISNFISLTPGIFLLLGFTGQLLIFRLTARGLHLPRLEMALSSSISLSTDS